MDRREFLTKTLLATAGVSLAGTQVGCSDYPELPLPPGVKEGPNGKKLIPWSNWSGYLHCYPHDRTAPKTEEALATLMRDAKGPIRPVGAGHSFTPLVPTDEGTIVSLRRFSGLIDHDPKKLTATFGAGTKLGQVGDPLDEVGQALPNMPDIDEQTLAGAMSTATHGSSERIGALHAHVIGLKLVTPQGEVIECSREQTPEIFHSARVSLGSLGVITEYTLQNVPAHRLERKSWMLPFDDYLEQYDELVVNNHSVDSYFIPFFDQALVTTINPTKAEINPRGDDPDKSAVEDLRLLRNSLAWWPSARRLVGNTLAGDYPLEVNVDQWHRIYPSERAVRFNEMEYHMDRKHLVSTIRKVKEAIEKHHPEVYFPCEVRSVAGDDAWLSPFYGHASGSIAVHRFHREDPLPLFETLEPIFRAIDGRPHWGKMNTLGAADFEALYPKWQAFQQVRGMLDPQGKMLNPYLKKVFGVA